MDMRDRRHGQTRRTKATLSDSDWLTKTELVIKWHPPNLSASWSSSQFSRHTQATWCVGKALLGSANWVEMKVAADFECVSRGVTELSQDPHTYSPKTDSHQPTHQHTVIYIKSSSLSCGLRSFSAAVYQPLTYADRPTPTPSWTWTTHTNQPLTSTLQQLLLLSLKERRGLGIPPKPGLVTH